MDYDFLAVGDIVTDAFIKLKEAEVKCDLEHEHCKIAMPFGDKIPYEEVWVVPAVGNSPNAAVAAARLGLKSGLVSNLGDDFQGKECLASLASNNVSAEHVKAHPGAKTNYHYVLWYGDDRTILIKHEKYEYHWPEMGSVKWMYLSSLGESVDGYHEAIADYLAAHPEVKMAFQPGTFQIRLGTDHLRRIYERSEIFFCNKEEAQLILKSQEEDVKKLMEMIRALGPKIAVVTDGPSGAYASSAAEAWFINKYPDPKPPYERTGAGDAFSSTMTVALALGKSIPEAMRWGAVNSMSVVQKVGAQAGLLSQTELEAYLEKAPAESMPKQI